jgi:hypothetical protein
LFRQLRDDGFSASLVGERTSPGQYRHEEVVSAVRNSDVLVICLSRGSVSQEGRIRKEVEYVLDVAIEEAERKIFPILLKLEECDIPHRLRQWQWVNLFEKRGYEQFTRVLRSRASTLGIPAGSILVLERQSESSFLSTQLYLASPLPRESQGIALVSREPRLTVYYLNAVPQNAWTTLLVYVHLPAALDAVKADSQKRLGLEARNYEEGHAQSTVTISRGAEIVVVPQVPGICFNPPHASVLWLEDWHRVEFRMRAAPNVPGFKPGAILNGRVSFYVGPIMVGEIRIGIHLTEGISKSAPKPDTWSSSGCPFQAIFVSYSHRDTALVEKLEKAYTVLGLDYLRDVRVLRSGEKWDPALLRKIEEANIFQLCWSRRAKSSVNVKREWHHALELKREYFIRPIYWEKPMPKPPGELKAIHFAHLDW